MVATRPGALSEALLSAPRQEAIRLIREQLCCIGQIFEDPQCLDCKHNFCRACILLHLRQVNALCPRCQLPTRPSEVTRNQFLESILAAWKAVEVELASLGDPECHAAPIAVEDTDRALHRATAGSQLASEASPLASNGRSNCSKTEAEHSTRGRVANNKWNIDTQEIRQELRLEQPYYPQHYGQQQTANVHAKTSSSDLPDDYGGRSSRSNGHSRRRSNGDTVAGQEAKSATVSLAEASAVGAGDSGRSQEGRKTASHSRSSRNQAGNGHRRANDGEFPGSSPSQPQSLMATQEVESYMDRITKQREALSQWERSRNREENGGKATISAMERALQSGIGLGGLLRTRRRDPQQTQEDEDESMTQMPMATSVLESPDLLASFQMASRGQRRPWRVMDEDEEHSPSHESERRPGSKAKRGVQLASPAPPLYPRGRAASPSRKRLRVPSSQAHDGFTNGHETRVVVGETQKDSDDDYEVPESQPGQAIDLEDEEDEEEYEMKPAMPLPPASELESPQPGRRHGRLSDLFSGSNRKKNRVSDDFQGAITAFQAQGKLQQPGNGSAKSLAAQKVTSSTQQAKSGGVLNAAMRQSHPTLDASSSSNGSVRDTSGSPSYVFVGTDITREESKRVLEACQQLGGIFGRDFDLQRDATSGALFTSVTHLITKSAPHIDAELAVSPDELRCKRTAKYMRALADGCFVMDFSWVTASLTAGKWLTEEPFEMVGDIYSDAVGKPREARLRRAQTGRRNDILSMFRFVLLVSEHEFGFQFASVRALVDMFGGSVTRADDFAKLSSDQRTRRTPIGVVSKVTTPFDAKSKWQQYQIPIVRITWIFDSISHLEVLPFDDYYPY
ncbi:hypothetical protein BBJ28_00004256 [Nothophytophthora sp. Chile5]|nr:hypothetical protein BBJ28_00004256 [Nothophytophthora sp. Chile5]